MTGIPHPLAALAAFAAALFITAESVSAQAPEGRCLEGTILSIEIDRQEIYPVDPGQPRLLRWALGTANLLHIETTESFIRRELLFSEGDCFDDFVVAESRRLLQEYDFLARVDVEVTDAGSGDKVVHVTTQDEWSTQIDVGIQYDDGFQIERFQATEQNFLGNGILLEASHAERRERRDREIHLATPRLFGPTDASIRVGRSRGGSYVHQAIARDFLGETNRFAASQAADFATGFYSYSTGGTGPFTHLLVPMRQERLEIAAATRIGDPGRSWRLGMSVERRIDRLDGVVEVVEDEDFGASTPTDDPPPDPIVRQAVSRGATRVGLHVGAFRLNYREYAGLDAVTAEEIVTLGFIGTASLGRSIGALAPTGVPAADDTYARLYTSTTIALGQSLIQFTGSAEGVWADGDWRDLLAEASIAAYGRADWLPNQTLFAKAVMGGGWRTTMPFQLALGGRDGVRSLRDDVLPGGRRLHLMAENRIDLGWPSARLLALGMTLFADAGRMWAQDAPFGTDSDWFGSVGFGLRIESPAGRGTVWRPEIAFPVGHDGSPVFRVTFELNRLRLGFGTPRWTTSRRFRRGAESF